MTVDTVLSLYHSGALFAAGIVAVYLLARWAVGSVPYLKQPQHAHYATAAVTALGLVALPLSQGTTPNMNMLVAAIGTLAALLLPGVKS